jgi:3-phenylpropionate/cinnamic acid dioxygenase small subunit
MNAYSINLELIAHINAFYFCEARLLDARQYQQWLALMSDKIEYTVPARHTPLLDNSLRDTEAFLNLEQEFSHGIEPPLRDEKHLHLMIRVMRSLKINAWTENPPARTRRFVSNIEIIEVNDSTCTVFSNTLLYYNRHAHDTALYSYQRKDTLERCAPHDGGEFRLLQREVLLDFNVITGPSAGLFF